MTSTSLDTSFVKEVKNKNKKHWKVYVDLSKRANSMFRYWMWCNRVYGCDPKTLINCFFSFSIWHHAAENSLPKIPIYKSTHSLTVRSNCITFFTHNNDNVYYIKAITIKSHRCHIFIQIDKLALNALIYSYWTMQMILHSYNANAYTCYCCCIRNLLLE